MDADYPPNLVNIARRFTGFALDRAIALHGKPRSITVDHGTEFTSRALDEWAYRRGVLLDFIRPGKPVENGYIESFNGKLRDCLNANQFLSIDDARSKIEAWRTDSTCIARTAGSGMSVRPSG